jgi:hypothetical protein
VWVWGVGAEAAITGSRRFPCKREAADAAPPRPPGGEQAAVAADGQAAGPARAGLAQQPAQRGAHNAADAPRQAHVRHHPALGVGGGVGVGA